MSTVFRRNRKGSDRDITRLNALGFSLAAIGLKLNCHPTSITLRLKSLNIRPADTRRSFMEDIYNHISDDCQEKIADTLEDRGMTIKDYVRELIMGDLAARSHNQPQAFA
jgi:hypothetical protein